MSREVENVEFDETILKEMNDLPSSVEKINVLNIFASQSECPLCQCDVALHRAIFTSKANPVRPKIDQPKHCRIRVDTYTIGAFSVRLSTPGKTGGRI